MNTILNKLSEDIMIKTGLIFITFSLLLFFFTTNVYDLNFDIFTGVFFANFLFTIIYFFLLLRSNSKATGRAFKFHNFTHNVLLLQLFNISAYSLNRSIPVFNISADWVVWFLVISNSLLVLHVLRRDYSNTWLNQLTVFVASVAILFHVYEAIYVFPMYVIGVLAFWFFGVPMHIFVPILYVWAFSKVLRQHIKHVPDFKNIAIIGAISAVIMVGQVVYRFNTAQNILDEIQTAQNEDNELPKWLQLSQQLPKDGITERVLKAGLVYTTDKDIFQSWGFTNINEQRKHDPLVVLGTFFSKDVYVSDEDKIKILGYMYDARHQTERKLWSGHNLSTQNIKTTVQLFPEYRLAYTEKILDIHNSIVNRWGSQQEALYTFYVPEGSVVTSASLWVEGTERPALLTTKGKADSAYTTIVGVERRDPLVLHWQEGNRVTIRVFPCTPNEDRKFKIGITTPLAQQDGQLIYNNIDFEGPYWKSAREDIKIITESPLEGLKAPFSFKKRDGNYTYLGRYKSDWSLRFDAPTLSQQPFSFNGKSYQLQTNSEQLNTFDANEIYIDFNVAWTKKEWRTLWESIKDKKVYTVVDNQLTQITATNETSIFKGLRKQNFTLFPFHLIQNPNKALVITKYNQTTPTLDDLEETAFLSNLNNFFKENEQPIKVYHLNEGLSPYLKTLKEFRSIQVEQTALDKVITQLKAHQFNALQENAQTIVNDYADFQIKEVPYDSTINSDAPDHLLRLFAYNNVLKAVGQNFYNKKELENELIATAQEAHVVTPISSLIVLETQKDYDRFDIEKSENSLDNAAIKDSGAVPEPHEWLLILLVLGITMVFYFRGTGR